MMSTHSKIGMQYNVDLAVDWAVLSLGLRN